MITNKLWGQRFGPVPFISSILVSKKLCCERETFAVHLIIPSTSQAINQYNSRELVILYEFMK